MGAALVAANASLGSILLIEELNASLHSLGVGIIRIAAVNDASHAVNVVNRSVALIHHRGEEVWIASAALLCLS